MARAATSPATRGTGPKDHRIASKTATKPLQVVPNRPNNPAHPNGNSSRVNPSDGTALQQAIRLIQGKWKIAILCHLQDGPVRVGELKRRMSPISKKVLNHHLRQMERDGLLTRAEFYGRIPHVEYALTNPLGRSMLHLLETIALLSRRKGDLSDSGDNTPA